MPSITSHFQAQNDSLVGRVTAQQDEAVVKGVRVFIVELNRWVETTELGNFRFPVVPDGSYTIRFVKENFETLDISDVAIIRSRPAVLNVEIDYETGLLSIPAEMQPDAEVENTTTTSKSKAA